LVYCSSFAFSDYLHFTLYSPCFISLKSSGALIISFFGQNPRWGDQDHSSASGCRASRFRGLSIGFGSAGLVGQEGALLFVDGTAEDL